MYGGVYFGKKSPFLSEFQLIWQKKHCFKNGQKCKILFFDTKMDLIEQTSEVNMTVRRVENGLFFKSGILHFLRSWTEKSVSSLPLHVKIEEIWGKLRKSGFTNF